MFLLSRLAGERTEDAEKSFTNFVLVSENSDLHLQVQGTCTYKLRVRSTQGRSYTVKKFIDFTVLSRDVSDQTLLGREKFNYSWLGRVPAVTPRLGTGKSITFFDSVQHPTPPLPQLLIPYRILFSLSSSVWQKLINCQPLLFP
jgi:hypothetical protein